MPLSKPSFSREHRLGLVVYGGISLAIYMNGVCQEFYNAVRGRGIYKLIKALTDADIVIDIISGTSAGGINGVLLSYALANSDKNEEIRINFKECSNIWLENGDIQKLFWKKGDLSKKHITSLFNGDNYFKEEIQKALEKLWDNRLKTPQDDWVSNIEELDLYVTGTDILGRIHQTFDHTGCVVEIKDHHAVFHLKYRQNLENDLSPNKETREALAKLCQITACFPLAFSPVTVKLDDIGDDKEIDKKLVQWGELKKNRFWPLSSKEPKKGSVLSKIMGNNTPSKGRCLHFFDGGILDNRPFTHTIKEIYQRTAKRPVFRKLFYIDPSPDHFTNSKLYQEMQKPNALEVVVSALRIPAYEGIGNDLELIKEHNEKVRRYKSMVMDIENFLDLTKEDKTNEDIYDKQREIYLRTRLVSLKDKLLPLIFVESENQGDTEAKVLERKKKLDLIAEILAKPFTDPQELSDRLSLLRIFYSNEESTIDYTLSRNLDVDFTLRKYFFVAEYIYKLLDTKYLKIWLNLRAPHKLKEYFSHGNVEESLKEIEDSLRELLEEINDSIQDLKNIQKTLHNLFACGSIESYFFNEFLPETKICSTSESKTCSKKIRNELLQEFPDNFYRAMLWLHAYFLEINENKVDEIIGNEVLNDLNKLKCILKDTTKNIRKALAQPVSKDLIEKSKRSYIKTIEQKTQMSLEKQNREDGFIRKKLLAYFTDFEKVDAFLYPLDYWAGISEKQLIEVHRISPEDAKLGLCGDEDAAPGSSGDKNVGSRLDKKIAGNNLNSFGGFLKKSWRANDILWGRLDGLNRIVECLITKSTIENFTTFIKNQESVRSGERSVEEYLGKLLDEAILSQDETLENKKHVEAKRNSLQKSLEKLIKYTENPGDEEIEEILQEIQKDLVCIGHMDIIHYDKELDNIVKTQIQEQIEWRYQRQYQSPEKTHQHKNQKEKKLKFIPTKGTFNSFINLFAIKNLVEESIGLMSFEEKEILFRKNYQVGSEDLDDIPNSERKKISRRFIQIVNRIIETWQIDHNNSKSLMLSDFFKVKFLLRRCLISVICFTLGFCLQFLSWFF